ncbi:hypothetical protein ACHJH3_10825 [Campylobacter sp. MOP7]|uniref:hypothetical protein n=1 Tax=Campylobacter canis TaxID=3378588 RepID=UPI00387EB183
MKNKTQEIEFILNAFCLRQPLEVQEIGNKQDEWKDVGFDIPKWDFEKFNYRVKETEERYPFGTRLVRVNCCNEPIQQSFLIYMVGKQEFINGVKHFRIEMISYENRFPQFISFQNYTEIKINEMFRFFDECLWFWSIPSYKPDLLLTNKDGSGTPVRMTYKEACKIYREFFKKEPEFFVDLVPCGGISDYRTQYDMEVEK